MDQDIPHIPIVSTTEIGVDSGLRFTVVENFFFLCSVLPAIRGELSLCSVFAQSLLHSHKRLLRTETALRHQRTPCWKFILVQTFRRIRVRCSCIFSDRRICRDSVGHDLTLLLIQFLIDDWQGWETAGFTMSGGHVLGRRDIDWETLVTDPIAWRVNFRQSSFA